MRWSFQATTGAVVSLVREGVASVWLVDPLARTLESFQLDDRRWTVAVSHAGDEVVRVAPFDAIEITLARWWLDSAPA